MAFPLLFRRYFVVIDEVSLKKHQQWFRSYMVYKKCSHTDVLWMCGLTFIWKNHNSIMFVWGLFCILRIALKPDRKYAVRLISKTAISSSGRADDNQDCCMVRGSRPRWRSNFSKLFWIRSPYYHPCKVEHCHCLAIQDGSDQWKSPHRRVGWNGKLKTQVNLSEIRTTHYGGYHRRWLGFGKSGWLRRE